MIYVSINAKGSATHGNAVLAEELFYEEHPDARETMRITVIDGKTYTCGYGFAVIEAARIDGAGEFRIFWQRVMPLVKPAWLTLIIFSFKNLWNIGGTVYIQTEQL